MGPAEGRPVGLADRSAGVPPVAAKPLEQVFEIRGAGPGIPRARQARRAGSGGTTEQPAEQSTEIGHPALARGAVEAA